MSFVASLLGLVSFTVLYYWLWRLWCGHSYKWLPATAPAWVKQPALWAFLLVTFLVFIVFRRASK